MFGESWQIVQVPEKEAGIVTGPEGVTNVWLFRPATPAITMGFVLNRSSPRAIARRASAIGRPLVSAHAVNSVKTSGINGGMSGSSQSDR